MVIFVPELGTAKALGRQCSAHPSLDFLLLDGLVNGGVQFKLFGALGGLQADHHVGDGLSVSAEWVLSLLWGQLCDLTFVDLFRLLDTKPCGGEGRKSSGFARRSFVLA